MKMNTIDAIRHVNAAIMLAFSVSYSYLNDYYELGMLFWAFTLPFLYFPDLIRSPEVPKEAIRDLKIVSIFSGWFFLLLWWAIISKSNSLIIADIIFSILLTVYAVFYVKKWKKEDAYKK